MSDKIKVLYLDDEENNLTAFKSFFRKEYEVYTATVPDEALALLKEQPIQIIVTDQRMPIMTGVEFLEKTLDSNPESIRLLITGQSDINLVIESINRGRVNKYIQKPWDWDKLKLMMENCCDLYWKGQELKFKNEELQKANDELNRFIYSVSHDLRSPLMSILGIVQLAKMDESTNHEYFNIIENSVNKLDRYVKNIIEYYQNSRSEESIEKADINEMVHDIIDLLRNQDQNTEFEVQDISDSEFAGDAFRLKVVLNNIIGNAIKYKHPEREKHKVTVKIDAKPEIVKITVSDSGIGIDEEHIDKIFKMFYRAQITNNKQGSGLGLFIVKESLNKVGGDITVTSKLNEGSSFEISIPNKISQYTTSPTS
ncbi:MAG: hybrid sensor histidine kinase/response regulator [Bacteroidetes bacterium]|nr:hybrid sensor histidine kinase/response regulator [Bacteroidota bacterium]